MTFKTIIFMTKNPRLITAEAVVGITIRKSEEF
ncbi:unnamed protein product [Medioppia subpectinata]|uniref:Uncharacterized protein n=1 Tax=Medioppia subpectinata TaxID=1979941 RepID=A0A7R9LV20_9ACAR|nr:unnamed protein product [Medioppia subpectinata]CAG2122012.1 unnamed protein product [Medioppia subpectinata]